MLKWELPKVAISEVKASDSLEPGPWPLEWLAAYDDELRGCKSMIDRPYAENRRRFEAYTILMEPSRKIKDIINKEASPQLLTNAGIKLIELLVGFRPLKGLTNVMMFDNASAPGAFIMAMNYWTSTIEPMAFDWMASSLISTADNTALGDSYGLARLYPHKFSTYGTKFDGNTFDTLYLRHMANSKHKAAYNFYTSDLGMFVPEDRYNCQEAYNARGNLGQIMMGLIVLKPGGIFITKQFANMSSFTLSLMVIVTSVFDKTHVAKPVTSKPDNSETYIVAQGYLGTPTWLMDILFTAVAGPWDEYDMLARDFAPPMIPMSLVSPVFLSTVEQMTRVLVTRQCAKIAENLAEYRRMVDSGDEKPSPTFLARHVDAQVTTWFKLIDFKRMPKSAYMRTSMMSHRPAGVQPKGRGKW